MDGSMRRSALVPALAARATVEGEGEAFTVNGSAMVVCGDIHTDNATVYVIDEVLHPPA